jgi:hypothetical protein
MSYAVGAIYFLFFILFPVCLVVFNNRFSRKAKLVGVLVSVVFSWVGFIVFYLMMAAQKRA